MSELWINTANVTAAADDLIGRADDALQMTALTFADVHHDSSTLTLATLARLVGAYPVAFMEQASLVSMAVRLGVADAVIADRLDDGEAGPL